MTRVQAGGGWGLTRVRAGGDGEDPGGRGWGGGLARA